MTKQIKGADLFCGAGGTSTGLIQACEQLGLTLKLTAINHWDVAAQSDFWGVDAASEARKREMEDSYNSLVKLLAKKFSLPVTSFLRAHQNRVIALLHGVYFVWEGSSSRVYAMRNMEPACGNCGERLPSLLLTKSHTDWKESVRCFMLNGITHQCSITTSTRLLDAAREFVREETSYQG